MNRRRYLLAVGAGTLPLAGCMERLGFEEESAWRNPPMVADRPDAVYVPASMESMGMYGQGTAGDYAVSLMYSVPHRFWLVGEGTERVEVGVDDTHHLMCSVWQPDSGRIVPVELTLELHGSDGRVDRLSPWPMLSQRMGFHYGDNVTLPEPGEYTARITVGPATVQPTGTLADRFESVETLEIPFEYARADINDISFEPIPEGRRGSMGALEPMDHGRPTATGPPLQEIDGELLGQGRSGDAVVSVLTLSDPPVSPSDPYLAVFLRTPYNDVFLPDATVTVQPAEDEPISLEEHLDGTVGHHYGTSLESQDVPPELTVTVESPPAVARHDGYETAFLSFEPVTVQATES